MEDFDYFVLEARYGGTSEPPQSFGDFSGAGLWRIPLMRTSERALKAKEVLLSGLAFYESARTEECRLVKCNGRRTVYLLVTQAVKNLAS